MNPGSILVTDQDGVRGTLLTSPAQSNQPLIVQLEDGQQVSVPSQMLERRADGSHYLALRLREWAHAQHLDVSGDIVVPVVVEEATVEKRVRDTGGVRIAKLVHEHDEVINETLVHEEVDVQRVPVNRIVDGPVAVRQEGDTLIVPVLEEVVVKQLILREEIHITRRRVETHEPQHVTLRREEVVIERLDETGQVQG